MTKAVDPTSEAKAISAERQAASALRRIVKDRRSHTDDFLIELADRLAVDAERRTLKMTGAV